MTVQPSDQTTVVAVYSARHYAEMARDLLDDVGIHAFVSADDVHVPLQLTEGVRLIVLEREAKTAHDALAEAKLLPDDVS